MTFKKLEYKLNIMMLLPIFEVHGFESKLIFGIKPFKNFDTDSPKCLKNADSFSSKK